MQYIYIDTKIVGAIHQLIEYFQAGVFSLESTTVYIKEYKECYQQFSKLLSKKNIQFKGFKKYSDIQMNANSVVFYLFNAQSNCRVVANRDLVHIFVTHGESNKVSSIKPIIRIYDYVICSGMMGINRYLNYKIFYPDDVTRNRLIMMGNTFIGNNNYHYEHNGRVLYAPTWEGGIPEENYSSLQWNDIFEKILDYLRQLDTSELVIQPHPNLGHRDNQYLEKLTNGVAFLNKNNIKVTLVSNLNNNFFQKFITNIKSKGKIKLIDKYQKVAIKEAFCDISAMEVQLYNKKIPTRVFWAHTSSIDDLRDKFLIDYYSQYAIAQNQEIQRNFVLDENFYNYMFQYSFSEFETKTFNDRINWLVDYVILNHE